MAKPDAPREDGRQNDPLDDTTFETTSATTTADDTTQLEQTVQSDTAEKSDTTGPTRAIGVDESTMSRDLFGTPAQHADSPFTAVGADEPVIAPLPERPTGPHAPAIVLGLVCLAVAAIILAQELGNLTVDWGDLGPVGIIVTGAVLVLFGLVGLLTSRRSSKAG